MKASFKSSLLISFGFSLLLLIVSSVASYQSIRKLLQARDEVEKTNKTLQDLESVLSTLKDAETGQRGFLLTGNEKFLAPYQGSRTNALNLQARIKRNIEDPQQVIAADTLRSMIRYRIDALESLIRLKRTGVSPTITDLDKGKEHMDNIREHITLMEQNEQKILSTKNADLTQ